jgi:hypothetical protein
MIIAYSSTLVPGNDKKGVWGSFLEIIKYIFRIEEDLLTPSTLLVIFILIFPIAIIVKIVKREKHIFLNEFVDLRASKGERDQEENFLIFNQEIPLIFRYEYGRIVYLLINFVRQHQRAYSKEAVGTGVYCRNQRASRF